MKKILCFIWLFLGVTFAYPEETEFKNELLVDSAYVALLGLNIEDDNFISHAENIIAQYSTKSAVCKNDFYYDNNVSYHDLLSDEIFCRTGEECIKKWQDNSELLAVALEKNKRLLYRYAKAKTLPNYKDKLIFSKVLLQDAVTHKAFILSLSQVSLLLKEQRFEEAIAIVDDEIKFTNSMIKDLNNLLLPEVNMLLTRLQILDHVKSEVLSNIPNAFLGILEKKEWFVKYPQNLQKIIQVGYQNEMKMMIDDSIMCGINKFSDQEKEMFSVIGSPGVQPLPHSGIFYRENIHLNKNYKIKSASELKMISLYSAVLMRQLLYIKYQILLNNISHDNINEFLKTLESEVNINPYSLEKILWSPDKKEVYTKLEFKSWKSKDILLKVKI